MLSQTTVRPRLPKLSSAEKCCCFVSSFFETHKIIPLTPRQTWTIVAFFQTVFLSSCNGAYLIEMKETEGLMADRTCRQITSVQIVQETYLV